MNTAVSGLYPRVSLAFARLIDTGLVAFARNVITLITGNPLYPTPSPTLAVLTTAVNTFETAIHDALDGGRMAILARNAARVEVISLLKQLAAYVQGNCAADLVNLLGSGFDAVKAPSPVGVLPPPQNVRLVPGDVSGQLALRFDRVFNASNYSIQQALASEGPWEDRGLSTSTRVILGNLTPGKVYWARVRANGSAGPSDWGDPATCMAT